MRLLPQSPTSSRLSKPAHWSRALLAIFTSALGANSAFAAPSTSVVISQVYGGGGNTGATFTHDFVELHNNSTSSVSLAGMTLQYASATSTAAFSGIATLSGSIRPGGYFLVMLATGNPVGAALPTPDFTNTGINLSGTAGRVALVNATAALTSADFTGFAPTGSQIIDFVGYGTNAIHYEGGGRAPAPSNTSSIVRGNSGTTDTDANNSDFSPVTGASIIPRNSATSVFPADSVNPVLLSTVPADNSPSVGVAAPLSITFNEPILKGIGNVVVRLASNGSAVYTIDVAMASVTTSGQTATIPLPGVLVGSTAYYVTVDSGAFKDAANNIFTGISSPTAWNFTTAVVDPTPPVATLSPTNGTTTFPTPGNLVITYNEPILIGSGTILLKTGATTVESISVPGPGVTLSATTLTIDPSAVLGFGTAYSVEVPAGVITDQALNPSVAIAAGEWTFTTLASPSVIISQYYEGDGAGTSRYIELQNITGDAVSLDNYRLTCWSTSDPAGNQGWKSGNQTTPRVTTFVGKSIPANGFFLVADSGAANPEYAVVNPDLVVNNNPTPGATAFSGIQSIVLYSAATNELANISDAVSFVNNDGANKSFYRLNSSIGFDFATGTSILNFPLTWTSNKTLPEIAEAQPSEAWYLRSSNLPQSLSLSIDNLTFSEATAGTAATATVTRTGPTTSSLDVLISVNDPSEASAPEFVEFAIGEDSKTFAITAVNDPYLDGTQNVTIRVTATGLLSASQPITVTDELSDVVFPVVINEVDSDQTSFPDTGEFIELYNNSSSPVSLNGAILVLYNGNGNLSYSTIDLSTYEIPANGYFVIGGTSVANVDLAFSGNDALQNGADAVVLYYAPASLFPNGTSVTTPSGTIVDAVVYGNGQIDGAGLIAALAAGQVVADENAGSNGVINALARTPNGGSIRFNSAVYAAQLPTPGTSNGAGNTYDNWASANSAGGGSNGDHDNDGVKNGVEYFFGASGSTFTPNPQPNAAGLIAFPHPVSTPGATYVVRTSSDLVNWSLPVTTSESGGFVNYTIPSGQGKIFVRLEVTVPAP